MPFVDRSEVGGWRQGNGQRTEVRDRRSDVRCQKTEIIEQRSEGLTALPFGDRLEAGGKDEEGSRTRGDRCSRMRDDGKARGQRAALSAALG